MLLWCNLLTVVVSRAADAVDDAGSDNVGVDEDDRGVDVGACAIVDVDVVVVILGEVRE